MISSNSKVLPINFVLLILLFLVLQLTSIIGQLVGIQSARHTAADNIEKRVILDSAFLDVGNTALSTPVNTYAVGQYIRDINTNLTSDNYPIRLTSLQGVTSEDEFTDYSIAKTIEYENAEQKITLTLHSLPIYSSLTFSWLALLCSALLSIAFIVPKQRTPLPEANEEVELPPNPKLIINLKDKTLGNNVNDTVVILQNKPLCFYSALVHYCTLNPSQPLPPHKDVPIELVTLANKTFSRLIELGHTKRKRPDFNANLDKTLSEIRAALEEVFTNLPQEKERYYPPRAQGEGSRSKQHSYALTSLSPEHVEIIGK